MDEIAIRSLCEPLYAEFVGVVRDAWDDFEHLIPVADQPTVLGARAKLVSERLAYRLEQEFGSDREAPVRVQEVGDMTVLVVEGSTFDVGLRFKKFDGGYKTFNHHSEQQDELRRNGQFPPGLFEAQKVPMVHAFIGYRSTNTVQPKLRDIAISFERQASGGRYYRDWHHIIWNPRDGFDPAQTHTPPLPLPDGTTWRVDPAQPQTRPGSTGTDDGR